MVSQNFMVILHQQPHYSKPSNGSSSSTASSDVQDPLQIIKKENGGDDLMIAPSTSSNQSTTESGMLEPLQNTKVINEAMIKEEIADVMIKEEEEDYNDEWIPFFPETDKHILKVDKSQKDYKSLPGPCMALPNIVKDEEVLKLPSKRIRKKKIIYDPSDPSDYVLETDEVIDDKQILSVDISNNCKGREKDLTCGICGKYIPRLDYLRLHIMRHTGETPHKCSHCMKGYRTRWRLTQHLRTHTRELPFHCPHCNYRGNRSDYLASHIKRIHKKLRRNGYEKVIKEEVAIDNERKSI